MTAAAPGVRRRPAAEVPFTPVAIAVLRPVRDRGGFIVAAVQDAWDYDERELLRRPRRRGGR